MTDARVDVPGVLEAEGVREGYDSLRARCPVVHAADGSWHVTGHAEAIAVATDADAFSSAVSRHRAIPNSLDGDEHRSYRAVVDGFLTDERVAAQEPQCTAHARDVVAALPSDRPIDVVADLGVPFAVRAQITWLGWPEAVAPELVQWIADNRAATRSGDSARTAEVAERFDAIIGRLLAERRDASPTADVTTELLHATREGVPLTHAEVVSILRNWTAGDLSSLAACIGVIAHRLASDPPLAARMRTLADKPFERALNEILRADDPFLSNRRIATRDVELAGARIAAGDRVVIAWTPANRDPRAFADPDAFDPDINDPANLVFGIGPHDCPGKALTLMELRVATRALLDATSSIEHDSHDAGEREAAPVGGWLRVPVILHRGPAAPGD